MSSEFTSKCTVAIYNKAQLDFYHNRGVRSFLIRIRELSRMGQNSFEEAMVLIAQCHSHDIIPIIEWDIIMEEFKFTETKRFVSRWLRSLKFSHKKIIFRVQDIGAMYWLYQNYTDILIQLNLETGHRNLASIKKHVEFFGERVDRIVLSYELSKDKLKLYRQEIKIPLEILFHGRIPLFYSPRKLLTPLNFESRSNEWVEMEGESEESPHKGFPLIENRHGTFMFNVKELSLVDVYEELEGIGIDFLRLELQAHSEQKQFHWFDQIFKTIEQEVNFTQFKKDYPQELIRGFYSVNKSSILFEKLKNQFLTRDDDVYVGDVIEVVKPRHIAIQVKRSEVKVGAKLYYMTPEGKRVPVVLNGLKNSAGQEIESVQKGSVVFVSYSKGISAKSTVNIDLS